MVAYRNFETEIKGLEECTDESSFTTWLSYITYMEKRLADCIHQQRHGQNTASGGISSANGPDIDAHQLTVSLKDLYNRCVIKFKANATLHADIRFVRICIALANSYESPSKVYQNMYTRKIGTGFAEYYREWARRCMKSGNVKEAEFVLRLGILENAQPNESLLALYDKLTSDQCIARPSSKIATYSYEEIRAEHPKYAYARHRSVFSPQFLQSVSNPNEASIDTANQHKGSRTTTTSTIHTPSATTPPALKKCKLEFDEKNTVPDRLPLLNPFEIENSRICCQRIKPSLVRLCNYYMIEGAPPYKMEATQLHVKAFSSDPLSIIRHLSEGGYGNVFLAEHKGAHVAIKLQTPSHPWEFYILSLLQQRIRLFLLDCSHEPLKKMSSQLLSVCADLNIQMHAFLEYKDASVIIMQYRPASLLDVIDSYIIAKKTMREELIIYYTSELLLKILLMHRSNILHLDIKPDNIMINESRASKAASSSTEHVFFNRLQFIDFGRSLDLDLYAREKVACLFTGTIGVESFTCPQMLEKQPWTYEPDYFGIASTVYTMLFSKYLILKKTAAGEYHFQTPLRRRWNVALWEEFFSVMINGKGDQWDSILNLYTRFSNAAAEYASEYDSLFKEEQALLSEYQEHRQKVKPKKR